MNGTVLGKAILCFVWRFFKWLLVQSAIFCVLVLIFYYVVMNLLFGRSRLEWVDIRTHKAPLANHITLS